MKLIECKLKCNANWIEMQIEMQIEMKIEMQIECKLMNEINWNKLNE